MPFIDGWMQMPHDVDELTQHCQLGWREALVRRSCHAIPSQDPSVPSSFHARLPRPACPPAAWSYSWLHVASSFPHGCLHCQSCLQLHEHQSTQPSPEGTHTRPCPAAPHCGICAAGARRNTGTRVSGCCSASSQTAAHNDNTQPYTQHQHNHQHACCSSAACDTALSHTALTTRHGRYGSIRRECLSSWCSQFMTYASSGAAM